MVRVRAPMPADGVSDRTETKSTAQLQQLCPSLLPQARPALLDEAFSLPQSKAELHAVKAQRKAQRERRAADPAAAAAAPLQPSTHTAPPAPAAAPAAAAVPKQEPDEAAAPAPEGDLPPDFFASASKRPKLEEKGGEDSKDDVKPATAAAAEAPASSSRKRSAQAGRHGGDAGAEPPAASTLPEGFFDDAAADGRARGTKQKTAADDEAELEQFQRDVDAMERQRAEADAAASAEDAERQLALEKFELRCVVSVAMYASFRENQLADVCVWESEVDAADDDDGSGLVAVRSSGARIRHCTMHLVAERSHIQAS
jgi:hypothetical protein